MIHAQELQQEREPMKNKLTLQRKAHAAIWAHYQAQYGHFKRKGPMHACKLAEEVGEVARAEVRYQERREGTTAAQRHQDVLDELGDVYIVLCNYIMWLGHDPEQVFSDATTKFLGRDWQFSQPLEQGSFDVDL